MAFSATLARLNRRAINPLIRTFAGRFGPLALVIHRGRVSGRSYRTPVLAFPANNQFVIALVYGAEADWVKNVLAQGGCDVVARRQTVALTTPELRPVQSMSSKVPALIRAALRVLGTRQLLVLTHRMSS
jgi:deazaflavin-dependent oxidoreductase (nitroreductase family)